MGEYKGKIQALILGKNKYMTNLQMNHIANGKILPK